MNKEPKEIYLKDYKKPAFRIKSVNLTFELFEDETVVTNIMQLEKVDKNEKDLILHAGELELLELVLDEISVKEENYSVDASSLTIRNVSSEFTLKIVNKIYPQKNTELEGLYKSGDIFCTQNEP